MRYGGDRFHPLANVLCSVLIRKPAFGLGSGIRRGVPAGAGAFGASPAQALGRGGLTRMGGMIRGAPLERIQAPDKEGEDHLSMTSRGYAEEGILPKHT
jgi:hypothetical protein